jgi:hypothetical protein
MTVLDLADGEYSASLEDSWSGMVFVDQAHGALVAGGFPVKPPGTWFDNPRLGQLTPLTIDNTGHVYGHIAAWHTSHIGMSAGVKPPKSKSKYAFFATGALETEEGDFRDVGQITLVGGHAPLDATVADAAAHYDNTASAVMDVAIGEDRHGIWVSGGLRPEVTDEQVRAIRASSVSGDWRPINNNLELVAVCSVNVPGFPIPRTRVASGAPMALVAAGVEPLIELSLKREAGTPAYDTEMVSRVEVLETVLASIVTQRREELEEQVTAQHTAYEDKFSAIREQIKATEDQTAMTASLRERVRDNKVVQLRRRMAN